MKKYLKQIRRFRKVRNIEDGEEWNVIVIQGMHLAVGVGDNIGKVNF